MTRRLPTATTAPHTTTTTPLNGPAGAPCHAAMFRTHLNPSPSMFTYDHTASTAHGTTGLWQRAEPEYPGKQTTSQSSKTNPPSTTVPPKEPTTRERKFLDNPSTHETAPYGHHREPRYHATPKTTASSPPSFEIRDTAIPPSQLTTEQQQFRLNNPVRNRATAIWLPAEPWVDPTRVDEPVKDNARTGSRTVNPPTQLTTGERLTNLENVVKEQRTRLIWYQVRLDRLSTATTSASTLRSKRTYVPIDAAVLKNTTPPAPNAESQKATTAAAQPPPIDVNAKLELMTQQFQVCLIVAMVIIAISVYDRAFMSTPHYWALCLSWLHIVFVPKPGGPRGLLGKPCDQLKDLPARVQRCYDPPRADRGAPSKPTHGAAATPNGPDTPTTIAAAATPPSPADVNAKLELLTSHFQICLLTAMPLLVIFAYKPLLVSTAEYQGLVFLWLVAVLIPKPGAPRGILGRLSNQWKDVVTMLKWQGDDIEVKSAIGAVEWIDAERIKTAG
ncbi:hypothetical protein LTR27_007782 [Elasticomyces elasticus]|nr:hypothetical protein LTR27_007782 [Elasticomyces elasticus]